MIKYNAIINLLDTTREKFQDHRKKPSVIPFETTIKMSYFEIDKIAFTYTMEYEKAYAFYFAKFYGKTDSSINQVL